MRQNSLKAWILAARPKTLAGAAAPPLVGIAIGWIALCCGASAAANCLKWLPAALLCLLFAVVLQIDANFINDYFDYKKGADSVGRLGPERACTKGWITPRAMKRGIAATTLLGCLIGAPLICYGGWGMLMVGAACVVGAFIYTTWLSYKGLGDFMVVLFFGIVPVLFTYHVIVWPSAEALGFSRYLIWGAVALLCGFCVGFIVDNLLIINNYRDRDIDRENNKKTLVVRLGAKSAEWLYLLNGVFATLGAMVAGSWCRKLSFLGSSAPTKFPFFLLIPLLFLPLLFATHKKMVEINHGKELNVLLGKTARNIIAYCLILIATLIGASGLVW